MNKCLTLHNSNSAGCRLLVKSCQWITDTSPSPLKQREWGTEPSVNERFQQILRRKTRERVMNAVAGKRKAQIKMLAATSLVVQWLRLCLPMQGVWVQYLVRKLRSHMPRGQKSKNIKQKQYYNKFNKKFLNSPYQKNLKKKKKTLRNKMFAEQAKAKRFQFAFQNFGDAQDLTQTAKKGRGSTELQAICIRTLGSLVFLSHQIHGTPDGSSGKEHTCQCKRYKRCSFDPWVGKIPWRRQWQSTSVFLPGESHGQRSLAGYSL